MRMLVIFVLAITPACFSPETPACAYACGPGGLCPNDYSCMADGYCHYKGTTGQCPYPDAGAQDASDLSGAVAPDLFGTD